MPITVRGQDLLPPVGRRLRTQPTPKRMCRSYRAQGRRVASSAPAPAIDGARPGRRRQSAGYATGLKAMASRARPSTAQHLALHRQPVERRVAGSCRHGVALDLPRRVRVEQDQVGGHAGRQRAGVEPEHLRRIGREQREQPFDRQFRATSASASNVSAPAAPGAASAKGRRFSSGPRGSWPEHSTSIVPSATAASAAWRSLSSRSGGDRCAKVRKSLIAMSDSSRCAGVIPHVTAHAAPLGRADQVEPGRGRHLAEMQPRAGLLGQHQVARDRQRLGDRRARRAGRAASRSRPRSRPRRRSARHPRHGRSPSGRGRGHRPAPCASRPNSAIQRRPVDDRLRARRLHDRHFGEVGARPARCVAAAIGWIHRSGLPISAARWTMPGSSSTGD